MNIVSSSAPSVVKVWEGEKTDQVELVTIIVNLKASAEAQFRDNETASSIIADYIIEQ